MRNINRLFEYNDRNKLKFQMEKGRMVFTFTDREFNGNTIKKIIGIVNAFEKQYKKNKVPIQFYFKYVGIVIRDKLSYVLFECVCYYLIHYLRNPIEIVWQPKDTIWTQGVFSSPLLKISGKGSVNEKNVKEFQKLFHVDRYNRHYRRVISADENLSTNYLGDLYQEIDSILKIFNIKSDYRDEISQMCVELVGNAGEHASADCLIDIDVTSDHGKVGEDGKQERGSYYGINIVALNFSEELIGDALKHMINNDDYQLSGRYLKVRNAYNNHKKLFSEWYSEDDFFNISVFQDKVSGRGAETVTGGKGLTLFIKTMQEKADSDQCYMLSGKKSLIFEKSFLEYDEQGWIGFNMERDYFDTAPEKALLENCCIYLPGTAYNLNFVLKREDFEDE